MTPPRPKATERIFVVGKTQSGKSTLARAIFDGAPPPRLVVDPKDDPATTGGAYAVTFHDPHRLPEAPVARFVPRDPFDLGAYDALYRRVFDSGPRYLWADDVEAMAPSQGAPRGLRTCVKQGARRGIGHINLSQRPVDVDPNLLGMAEHLIIFQTHHPDDVRRLAGVVGASPSQLDGLLRDLPPFGFLWYCVRQPREIARCRPLRR